MKYHFVPMNAAYAHTIVDAWKYENEYSIYDYSNEAEHILDVDSWGKGLFAILNPDGELVGELSIEIIDAQDQYTDYQEYENEALVNQRQLWVGFGLRPDLVGRGSGAEFVTACVDYAVKQCRYRGEFARLGVATFNQRAIRAYEKAGFQIFEHTTGDISAEMFECVYMRKRLGGI